jgi:hypothetical protein
VDRFALFVDAGYLPAEGGKLRCGTGKRDHVRCDHSRLLETLIGHLRSLAGGLPLLRGYRYDGGPGGQPVGDHPHISCLPNVKLRLGRLTGGEQKGVDTLPVPDLVRLAQEHAPAEVYILSGDEDLREGVHFAQQIGVRVVLLGIPPSGARPNQAAALVDEADSHIVLPSAFWQPFFSTSEPSGDTARQARLEHEGSGARTVGNRFPDEVTASPRRGVPRIPAALDGRLLRFAVPELGSPLDGVTRKQLRAGFWDCIGRTG